MVVTKETGCISNLLFADTAGFYFSFSIFPLKPESPDKTSGYTFPHGAVGRPLLTARSLHFSVTLSRRSHLLVALFKYIYLDADRFRDTQKYKQHYLLFWQFICMSVCGLGTIGTATNYFPNLTNTFLVSSTRFIFS